MLIYLHILIIVNKCFHSQSFRSTRPSLSALTLIIQAAFLDTSVWKIISDHILYIVRLSVQLSLNFSDFQHPCMNQWANFN